MNGYSDCTSSNDLQALDTRSGLGVGILDSKRIWRESASQMKDGFKTHFPDRNFLEESSDYISQRVF